MKISKVFFYQDLVGMPTLETDDRKVHLHPWLLKVSNYQYRIWINSIGDIAAERYENGDYRPFKRGTRHLGTCSIELPEFYEVKS